MFPQCFARPADYWGEGKVKKAAHQENQGVKRSRGDHENDKEDKTPRRV